MIREIEETLRSSVAPDYITQDFSEITPSEYLLKIAPASEVEHIIEATMPDEQERALLRGLEGDRGRARRYRA